MSLPHYNSHDIAGGLLRPSTLLDVGAGSGRFSRSARDLGCEVTAVDWDPGHVAALAADGFESWQVDLNVAQWSTPLEGREFDQIVVLDVLEHLIDPCAALLSIKKLLSPQGRLIISIPNVTHLDVRLALAGGRFPYAADGLLDRTHIRFFDFQEVQALLAAAGISDYEVLRVCRDGRPDALAGGSDSLLVEALAAAGEADVQQWVIRWDSGEPRSTLLERFFRDASERAHQLDLAAGYARDLEATAEVREAALADMRGQADQAQATLAEAAEYNMTLRAELEQSRAQLAAKEAAIASGGDLLRQLRKELQELEEQLVDSRNLEREVHSQRELVAVLGGQADDLHARLVALEQAYRDLEGHHLGVLRAAALTAEAELAAQQTQAAADRAALEGEFAAELAARSAAAQSREAAVAAELAAVRSESAAAHQERALMAQELAERTQELALLKAGMGYRLIQPGTRFLSRHSALHRGLSPLARGVLHRSEDSGRA